MIEHVDNDIVLIHGALPKHVCERLIAMMPTVESAPCYVYTQTNPDGTLIPRLNQDFRDLKVHVMRGQPEYAWVHQLVGDLFVRANEVLKLDAQRITEPAKLLQYNVGNHFRSWHADYDPQVKDDPIWRRITMSVQLSRPEDFSGGNLIFAPNVPEYNFRPLPQGTAVVFNAARRHAVKPVSRGTRYVLMNWIGVKPVSAQQQSFYEVSR